MTEMNTPNGLQQIKREWRPWYNMQVPPLCLKCQVPCIVKRTRTTADGRRIQHRYCPECGQSQKTSYDPQPKEIS